MNHILPIVLSLMITLFTQTVSSAQLLHHDPFKKPELEYVSEVPNETVKALKQSVREAWYPQLRATMRAGRQSMANVNGDIIKVGEKIDGFELVKVLEREALFIKNGVEYPISMDQIYEDEP